MAINTPLVIPKTEHPGELEAWRQDVVNKLEFSVDGQVRTTSSTTTTILAINLEALKVYGMEIWVIGRVQATSRAFVVGDGELHIWRLGAKLNASSNATLIGSANRDSRLVTTGFFPAGTSSWDTSITTDNRDIVIQVTGAVGDTIQWKARAKLYIAHL